MYLTVLAAAAPGAALAGAAADIVRAEPTTADAGATGPPTAAPLDQRRVRLITELSAQLLDLDAAALDVAATAHRDATPDDLALAIVLRAGRPIPPGLSAARRAQRVTRAKEALAWLKRELETESGRALIRSSLDLALSSTEGGMPSIPELEIAASFVVADLELVEYAPDVARLLGEPSLPEVRGGARSALYRLYARTFTTPADFSARWDDLRGRSPAGTGRDELRAAIDLANERALALLEIAPAHIGDRPLDWPDPQMAARAARSLGRAVAGGVLEPSAARGYLEDGLSDVQDPNELHARLGVLIDLAQGTDPESDVAREVRAAVIDVTKNSIASGPDAVWVAVGVLPRLQYAQGEEGDAERVETLRVGVDVFRIALETRKVRPLDPDALQAAIVALRDVARAVVDDEVRQSEVRLLMRNLRALVGERGVALSVRRAAANSLTISSTEEDALGLVDLIQSKETPVELGYELLGALKVVSLGLEPGSDSAELVVNRLFEILAEPDFDRRSRALELILSEEFAGTLDAIERRQDARWVVKRLPAESSPELREQLLRLVARIGDSETLALLIEEPGLIDELVRSGAPVARAVAEVTEQLTDDGDLATLVDVADRIAGPLGGQDALDPDHVERLRVALDLMLRVDRAQASTFSPEAHRWTLTAAMDLRRAYPVLAGALLDTASRRRLLELHATALAIPSDGENDQILAALARGLIGADMVMSELEVLDPSVVQTDQQISVRKRAAEQAVAGFDAAMKAPEVIAEYGWSPLQLRLECVELLRAVGLRTAALARLDALFNADSAADSTSGVTVPPRAVRLFAELVYTTVDGTAVGLDRERVFLASGALRALLAREGWADEDDNTRLRDLIALAELTQRADDPVRCAPSIEFLEGLLTGEDDATVARRLALGAADEIAFAGLQATIAAFSAPEDGGGEQSESVGGDEGDGGTSRRNP